RARIPASGVIWSADGVIVTADHVVERDDDITIQFADGSEAPATLVGRDPGTDLAVLRVAKAGLTPIAHAPAAKPGALALAVGRPSAGGAAVSFGVVSLVGGPWRSRRGSELEGFIRSDTTFYPGFSGGPLVDANGAAYGINSSRFGRGAGLTIPIATVARIIDALLSQGRIKRGYLGIGSQQAHLPAALVAKLNGQETGLLVVGVEPGSPADQAGLLIGDVLVAIDGNALEDTDDLHAQLGGERIGKATPLSILRGGEPREISVTVGERPE
ncbi:MAG TPA: trypsin-like peptidase domain-containing protein, partial [Tepidiformaceae bacterium]|nr:trypsin-like peptidase domain-containing protein [Tepidiformaceae bacterium]